MKLTDQMIHQVEESERRFREAFNIPEPHPENCPCDECRPVNGVKQ